jgi:hypothetical protein
VPLTLHDDASSKLVLTTGGQLVTDRYGMSAARAVWWYHGPNPEGQVAIFSNHPRWSFLEMDKRTVTRAEDGHWDIVGDYFGVQGSPEPIYALDISTGQEPLETHPDFATFAALDGPPPAPGSTTAGAVFDEDGLFIGFKSGEFIGVKAYLNASAVWRETRVSKTRPAGSELASIGKIDSPNGTPPTPSGRNWLFGSLSYEQKAKTFTIRREWLLSGPAGWNSTLYGP